MPCRIRVLVAIVIAASVAGPGAASLSGAANAAATARDPQLARPASAPSEALAARAAAARSWIASIPSAPSASCGTGPCDSPRSAATALQRRLEEIVADLEHSDPRLRSSAARIAVVDLTGAPRLAHVRGDEPVYPASVVKFVYLMAAYAWREQGRLEIDAELDADLDAMIRHSSNRATQKVFRRLTGTLPGAELQGAEYAEFRRRRLAIDDWVASLGIEGLHAVNPTYDGGGDLYGRDRQFLRDGSVAGGPPASGSDYVNRNAMTASSTARLLALLATDRALAPGDAHAVRERMKRDVREQPHLAARIAGGAATIAGGSVYSKSGTWGPIYADAGIVRDADGRQFALAVFTESTPAYRGDAIARLTSRLATHLFRASGGTT